MAVVLVTPPVLYRASGKYLDALTKAGLEVRYPTPGGRQLVSDELIANLDGVDFCLAGSEPHTRKSISRFPRLRVISRCGVGYDTVDMDAAAERQVAVGYTPGANHDSVAEQTFALLLAVAKKVLENHESVRSLKFQRRPMQPLRGRVLGLIGLGRIGLAVARLAHAFSMRVVAVEPKPDLSKIPPGLVQLLDLDAALAQSDFISLHAPLTAETKNLINRQTLTKAKTGVVVVNTARGGLVDESALAEALRSGKVSAAGLDVFADEPPVDSVLLDAPNVVFSPHVAGIDEDAIEAMALMAAQTIVDIYEGRWPIERLVNASALASGWKWNALA